MASFDIDGSFNPPTEFLESLSFGMDGNAGRIRAHWRVSAFTEDELVSNFAEGTAFPGFFARPGTETIRAKAPDEYTVEVSLSPSRLGRIQSIAQDRLDDLASSAGIRVQLLENQASGLTGGFNIPSVTESMEVGIGAGERDEHVFTFEPMEIPVPEGQSIVDDIPPEAWPVMSFTVRGEADTFGESILVFSDEQQTYQQRIPPGAFIEEVEISGDCESLHGNLVSSIDQLRSDVRSAVAGGEEALNTLEDAANQVGSAAGVDTSGGPSSLAQSLQDVTAEDLVSMSASNLRELRTRVEQADDKQSALDSAQDSFEDLRGKVRDQVGSNCESEIRGMLDDIEPDLEELRTISRDASTLKDALLSALSGIESLDCASAFGSIAQSIGEIEDLVGVGRGSPTLSLPISVDRFNRLSSRISDLQSTVRSDIPSDNPCRTDFLSRLDRARRELQQISREEPERLGCGDISKGIRDNVSTSVGAIRQYRSKDQLARLPDRKDELLQQVESAIQSVENNVQDKNPCKSELLGRARDAQQSLQRTPARPETAVPCEQRFSQAGNQIEQFEDQILALSAPVDPETVQEIANNGQQIIDVIEENVPEDDPCRSEMSERIRSLVQRVERLTPQIRVETAVQDEAAQRREELISQLLGSIDQLQATREGVIDTDISGELPTT